MRKLLFIVTILFLGCSASNGNINVMTFNIRFDTPNDSINAWPFRKDFAANCIAFYNADIVGLQEALHHQLEDLTTLLPDYKYVGGGRDDGKTQGEYSAILYNAKRFDVIESSTFWLSETPDVPGVKGWDAAFPRVVTWALMKDKQSGKKFYAFNTHFDHVGKVARQNSSKMLIEKVAEIAGDTPAVITGDFNASSSSDVIKLLIDPNNSNHFTDSRQIAKVVYGPNRSFHGYGRVPVESQQLIDFVFVKGFDQVQRNGVITEQMNGIYHSDHNPVLATVCF